MWCRGRACRILSKLSKIENRIEYDSPCRILVLPRAGRRGRTARKDTAHRSVLHGRADAVRNTITPDAMRKPKTVPRTRNSSDSTRPRRATHAAAPTAGGHPAPGPPRDAEETPASVPPARPRPACHAHRTAQRTGHSSGLMRTGRSSHSCPTTSYSPLFRPLRLGPPRSVAQYYNSTDSSLVIRPAQQRRQRPLRTRPRDRPRDCARKCPTA